MRPNFLCFLSLFPLFTGLCLPKANAQIVPDNSLGTENSIVSPNTQIEGNPATLIEGGAIRNTNLFHSFQEFGIPTDDRIYFANPEGIQNIFTRVTGNNISEIMGTLGVNGNANLFFMNPNGIIFGKDARLDLNGSFFATTATSLVWEEGSEFSANKPETAPLLTINRPIGLQMGNNSGSITVQGDGHFLMEGDFFPIVYYNDTSLGLQVDRGQTLGLISKDINLTGGIVRTLGGNIQLISVKEGTVKLDRSQQDWQLDTTKIREFSNIKLSDKALVDSSGIITGNIQIQGKNIELKDGSTILIRNLGSLPSGNITVDATDSIKIVGSIRNAPDIITPIETIAGVVPSRLYTQSVGAGSGGDIYVSGGNLSLIDSGSIHAYSLTQAGTGTINIDISNSIELNGYSLLDPRNPSLIVTANFFGKGNAGDINIFARNMNIFNGGAISSYHLGSGDGGDIIINVMGDLVMSGIDPIIATPSAIGSTSFRIGNSGNVTIDTARLSIFDGAAIGTTSLASGDAGQLIINATESIEVSGARQELGLISSIQSDVLNTNNITLRQILGIQDRPTGNSGSIIVNTPILTVTNGGRVGVGNQGIGDSGNLQINADRIFLSTQGNINAFSASGQGGNIELNINDSLLLRNGSFITAEATGNINDRTMVNGGNIEIDTPLITLLENSKINANAFAGNGGNIQINTQGLFAFSDDSISASSQLGLDGNIEIEIIQDNRNLGSIELTESSLDRTEEITTGCNANNSLAIVNRDGLPEDPKKSLTYNNLWSDLRSYSTTENRETIISVNPIQEAAKQLIEAQNWQINVRGNIELFANSKSQNVPQSETICPSR
jgi:filamentous hemagglutinin family protein